MKTTLIKKLSTIALSSTVLVFSVGAAAADWSWAEEEIANGNYGTAAGWVIDSLSIASGDEYAIDDGVCKDYTVTVEKHRESNPQGRGKYKEVIDVEFETFCQPAEEEV